MGFSEASFHSALIVCFCVVALSALHSSVDAAAVQTQDPTESVVEQLTSSGCPTGFVQLGLQCYSFSTDRKTWYDSFKTCNKKGARLATLSTCDDNNRVKQYLNENFKNATGASGWWVGGSDEGLEGDWFWSGTVTEVVYFDWCTKTGEPNNDNGENCLALVPSCDFQWNDRSCDYGYFRYICEYYAVPR